MGLLSDIIEFWDASDEFDKARGESHGRAKDLLGSMCAPVAIARTLKKAADARKHPKEGKRYFKSAAKVTIKGTAKIVKNGLD